MNMIFGKHSKGKDFMNIDYSVTKPALLAYGISERTITLSEQPFMRPGQIDFDIQYALAIWDARDRILLAALVINNPTEKYVRFPPNGNAYMGVVRD